MAEDKRRKGKRHDHDQVAADRGYEVEYVAETTGITRTQALALIAKHDNNRATLVRKVRKLKE
jgi:hypothetical protein